MTPALDYSAELLLLGQGIKVIFFDVDGVFTDGGLYFSDAGESLKRFHTLDGMGVKLLQLAGIVPVVISGRDSLALRNRLNAIGIQHMSLATENKLPAAERFLMQLGIDWSVAAAMGDDWPDLPLLSKAKIAIAPPNAHAEVLSASDLITKKQGGFGAVREACDFLLVSKGKYADILRGFAALDV
jgi:3-deoxy-D-manno-octulosonate 8-phosphate phosphatase (KDO 8-P phosphatase)